MPPRYAYWTILVDDQATAFRAAMQEDLMPTFKRLQSKNPGARLVWFQNGKIWNSRLEAQEAMRERGERGRSADPRQSGFRARKKPDWTPKPRTERPEPRSVERRAVGENFSSPSGERKNQRERLEWTPKPQSSTPRPRASSLKPQARDKNWRPGGEHKDPRQKYKDAKKAKWQRFKKTVRARWESKQGKKRDK